MLPAPSIKDARPWHVEISEDAPLVPVVRRQTSFVREFGIATTAQRRYKIKACVALVTGDRGRQMGVDQAGKSSAGLDGLAMEARYAITRDRIMLNGDFADIDGPEIATKGRMTRPFSLVTRDTGNDANSEIYSGPQRVHRKLNVHASR